MTEQEPIYEYIKGQGWVANGCESLRVTFRDGRKVTIYNRLPNEGELYCSIGVGAPAAVMYGDNFQGRCKWIADRNWTSTTVDREVHVHTLVFD